MNHTHARRQTHVYLMLNQHISHSPGASGTTTVSEPQASTAMASELHALTTTVSPIDSPPIPAPLDSTLTTDSALTTG